MSGNPTRRDGTTLLAGVKPRARTTATAIRSLAAVLVAVVVGAGASGCRPATEASAPADTRGGPTRPQPTLAGEVRDDRSATSAAGVAASSVAAATASSGAGSIQLVRESSASPVAGSTPAYSGELRDPATPARPRRIELHWLRPAEGGLKRPTLWEPDSQCATPLRAPAQVGVGHWVIAPEGDVYTPANDDCRPMRRIGALAGVDAVHVFVEVRGERTTHRIRVVPRREGNAPPVGLDGDLRPDDRIAGGQGGYFGEVSLREFGVEHLDGVHLVTNFGIFRGTTRAAATGRPGFTIVEATNILAQFAPGELYWSATTDPLERRITFAERTRFGDGRSCTDVDDAPFTMQLRLLALHAGIRTWAAEPPASSANARVCAVVQLNVTRCRRMGCLQWSDSLAHVAGEHGWFLTESAITAREIYARLPKWSIANRGYRRDVPRSGGRSDASQPWGECGLEGCDARHRREAIDSLLIDMWNR